MSPEIDYVKLIYILFALYAGVMSWLFKTAWNDIQKLKNDVATVKDDLHKSLDDKFNTFLDCLDEKFDSWWNKIECNLMNDGRLPSKASRKKKENE